MPPSLEDPASYWLICSALFVCAAGCGFLLLENLREHRARTAGRNASSFEWRH